MNKLQRSIIDLKDLELTESNIAYILSRDYDCICTQSTINRIYTGVTKNPAYDLGAALMKMHKDYKKMSKRKLRIAKESLS